MIRFTTAITTLGGLMLCFVTGCEGNSAPSGYAPEMHTVQSTADNESAGDMASPVEFEEAMSFEDDVDAAISRAPAPTSESKSSVRETSRSPADRKRFRSKSGRQSGVLTAGSFDDVANYHEFTAFLSSNQYQPAARNLPVNARSRQTVITVTNGQGQPLNDVRCVVTNPQSGSQQTGRKVLDMTTGTDGRLMLLTHTPPPHHRQQRTERLRLQVYTGQNLAPVIDEYRKVESAWNVSIEGAEANLPAQLDLALVIDTTGSMGDELEYLKTEIDSIVASVHRMFPDVDQRYSLITYRDDGDDYVCRTWDFTDSLDDFRRSLDSETANGGGDFPEAMHVALRSAEELSWRSRNTARVMFLVGDAPPHRKDVGSAMAAIDGLRQKGVRLFPVGASGVETSAQIVMRTASLLTMGQYLFLTDHSGVGNPHATPDVSKFVVERLDRLMIRMIASELAGKRLVPQEILAIEHGERYTTVAPVIQQTPVQRCLPPPQPATIFVVDDQSMIAIVFGWFDTHKLASLIALLSAVIVFERLCSLQVRRGRPRCRA